MQKQLSICTIFCMDKTLQQIKATVHQLTQVARKFAQIESLPITVEEGLVISTREAHTIQNIGEQSCANVTDVAICFGITKSAASQLVSKLTGKGFLVKRQSAHSNKELQLSLTPLGWQAFKAHEHFHGKDMNRVVDSMKNFSNEDIITLTTLLKTINTIIDERLDVEGED